MHLQSDGQDVGKSDPIADREIELVGRQRNHLRKRHQRNDRLIAQDRTERQKREKRGWKQDREQGDEQQSNQQKSVSHQQIACARSRTNQLDAV